MRGADVLLTCALVAVVLAAASGLIAALRPAEGSAARPGARRHPAPALLEVSLLALFLSFVPFVPEAFRASPATVWRSSSAVLGLALLAYGGLTFWRVRPHLRSGETGGALAGVVGTLAVLVLGLQCFTLFGARPGPGPYLAGLLLGLGGAALLFLRQTSAALGGGALRGAEPVPPLPNERPRLIREM